MYAFGSKVTIEFKLASGGPLGGCFRKGAPLPAGVTEAQAAAAMAPTNCDTLQARLDTICALNDKCKGFQKANGMLCMCVMVYLSPQWPVLCSVLMRILDRPRSLTRSTQAPVHLQHGRIPA
jgi:hypothetical protein